MIDGLASRRDVRIEPGWGTGNLVLKTQGKIFAILSATRFVAKLPRDRVEELLAEGRGTRFDPRKNGRVMKEWLVAHDESDWGPLAEEAYRFVRATTRNAI